MILSMKPYERLLAWEAAHQMVLSIYRATESWPKRELYGLVSQARRSAFSIAANIAEGVAKRGQPEFRRFLDIALGSASELHYSLRVARDLGYLTQDQWAELELQQDSAGKVLWGLYASTAKRLAR